MRAIILHILYIYLHISDGNEYIVI